MTIPAWLDREEYPFEPHFLKNTLRNYAKVVRFGDAGHFVSGEKTDELTGRIKNLIRS